MTSTSPAGGVMLRSRRLPPMTLVLEPAVSGALAPNPWLEDRVVALPRQELAACILAIKGVRFSAFPHGRFRYFRLPEWVSHLQFVIDTDREGRTISRSLQFFPAHASMREICTPRTRQVVVMHLRPGALQSLHRLPPVHQGPMEVQHLLPGLWEALTGPLAGASLTELISGMQESLLRDLAPMPPPDHDLIAAIETMVAEDGLTEATVLARTLGCSTRTVQRRFQLGVGMTPKTLSLIVRLRHALARAADLERPDWVQIAVSHGFSDHPHLVNTCTKYLGFPPGVFLRDSPTRMSLVDGAFLVPVVPALSAPSCTSSE